MTQAQRDAAERISKEHHGLYVVAESDGIVYIDANDGSFHSVNVGGESFDSGYRSVDDMLEDVGF